MRERRQLTGEEKEYKIKDMELAISCKKITGYQRDAILTQKEFEKSKKFLIDVYYCTRARFCSRCHSYIGEGDKLYTILALIPRNESEGVYDAFKVYLCKHCAEKTLK